MQQGLSSFLKGKNEHRLYAFEMVPEISTFIREQLL